MLSPKYYLETKFWRNWWGSFLQVLCAVLKVNYFFNFLYCICFWRTEEAPKILMWKMSLSTEQHRYPVILAVVVQDNLDQLNNFDYML